jgi:seryl-tRNA synthetase
MHDIKSIRDNPAAFDAGLKRRGLAPLSASLLAIDERRRAAITAAEQALARRNAASKKIGEAKRSKDDALAATLMDEVATLKDTIAKNEGEAVRLERELFFGDIESNSLGLASIPNLPNPAPDVPDGVDEHGNKLRHHFSTKPSYPFMPKPHFDLGEAMGFMDFEAAAKMSGARFVILKKGLARLERALGQFMLDLHTGDHGYTEVNPPLLVRDPAMFGTTQLPKFSNDQFRCETEEVQIKHAYQEFERSRKAILDFAEARGMAAARAEQLEILGFRYQLNPDRLWLIPTAEVPLTNLARESILDASELPMRLTALTPCFRAEAGAAGRDTRGMIRQHQFTKVELVSITTPETSKDEHERMLSCAEQVLQKLDLHYRVMTLCAGDMGFASQKTYDIEVWMPGQGDGGAYREISSCSVCGDFQARRMDARYRGPDGKPRFVHTLNGSGTAVGRALIAVMETYQQQDGSIAVPDVLQPYMGGLKMIEHDR